MKVSYTGIIIFILLIIKPTNVRGDGLVFIIPDEVKNELKEINILINSRNERDRVFALKKLLYMDPQYIDDTKVVDLINDSSISVKIEVYAVLSYLIPLKELNKKSIKMLQRELSKYADLQIIKNHFSKDKLDLKTTMSILSEINCLNILYYNHAIISPKDYKLWQKEVYGYVLSALLKDKPFYLTPEINKEFIILVNSISEPGVIEKYLDSIITRLINLAPNEAEKLLIVLSRHNILGETGPMHLNLKLAIKSKIKEIEKKFSQNDSENKKYSEGRFILRFLKC